MLVSFARLKSKRLALSQRITKDEERRRHDGVTVLLFFREHCTLTTTLEMGKICSNHLHFLSYLLKCPVDNAGNGISEPLNLKIFWRSMPPDGDPPYFGSPSDFQLFSFAYTFKLLRYTPEIYKNLGNLLFKTVSGGHFSSESLSTQLPLLWFRCKKGTS